MLTIGSRFSIAFSVTTCLLSGSALAQDFYGFVRNITLQDGASYTFSGPVRCEVMSIQGRTEVRSSEENRNERMPSNAKNDCATNVIPNTVQVACDRIVFEEGSHLGTWSNLLLYGGEIEGPVSIEGLRSRDGAPGEQITVSAAGLHGTDGPDGPGGRHGQDAGSSLSRGVYGAENGGNGQDGEDGTDGIDGADGNPGEPGENNVCITLHTESFVAGSSLLIASEGGTGGNGSDGQNGGHGGDGGDGGRGGDGGDSDPVGGRSRGGGNGGNGGDGGDGGDGGRGGDGGHGGDGGRIEVVIQEDVDGRGTRPDGSIALNNFGGEGGFPGVGGSGGAGGAAGTKGLGGPGGDGALIYDEGNPGSAGRDGEPGDPGDPGANGAFGEKGTKGEVVENVFGYGQVASPNPVDWNIVGQ